MKKLFNVRNLIVIIVLAVIAAYLLAGGGALPVDTALVSAETITAYVEDRAVTTLPVTHKITTSLFGEVLPGDFPEGSAVTQGQALARINSDNLKTALLESEHCITAFSNAVGAAQAKITASDAAMQLQKWLADAQAKLFAGQQISEHDFKTAKSDAVAAEVDFYSDTLHCHAMRAFAAALNLMPVYLNRYLDRAEIISPINGVVLKRHIANPQVLPPGAEIFELGDLSQLQITADLLSEDVILVRPGQTVEIMSLTDAGRTLTGRVDRINPAGFTKISSLGVEEQRVPVVIAFQLDAASGNPGVGYRVRVRIHTAQRGQALTIPVAALHRNPKGEWEVFVVRDGKAQPVTLEIGISNDRRAEVLKGLQKGDEVIIAPSAEIKPGSRVRPEN